MAQSKEAPSSPHVLDMFPYLHSNPAVLPDSTDPFTVTAKYGFLPLRNPPVDLPMQFKPVQKLAEQLPITKADGSPGLLANFELGPTVDAGALPDLTQAVDGLVADDGKPDLPVITAVFRDYSFLASAYLLEPCWQKWSKDQSGGYGLGRDVLPKEIAGPLFRTAQILNIPPFMSYAAAYALYNYRLADPKQDTSVYSNLRMIRAFERGLDPSSSEAGFVLTHVHMVQETGPLIDGALSLLCAIESTPHGGVAAAKEAFSTMLEAMARIETAMEDMWKHSHPKDYSAYRIFIFGITNQSMFPRGVVYKGINENQPLFFRGESGANDSIIPLLDHLLQVPMPRNPLTDILKDFRNYRPEPHRNFLSYVRHKSDDLGVRAFATHRDPDLAILYLRLLDHVRSFRWRHWLFAREYILKRSAHPTATGGSPIVTWLPNQLMAVMDLMVAVYEESGLNRDRGSRKGLLEMMDNVTYQREKLDKEVKRWCQERGA